MGTVVASGRGMVVAVVCTAVLVPGVAGPGVAAPSPDTVEAADLPKVEPVAADELAALASARATVASRMGRSGRAEYARSRAEEDLVDVHRDRKAAGDALTRVTARLEAARGAHRAAVARRRAAQEQFDHGVALSYKFGAASAPALVMAALQSASDAHDLARAVRELDGVIGHSYEDLLAQVVAAEAARVQVRVLQHRRGAAIEVVSRADAAIAPAEVVVDGLRATARTAEVAVLDAAVAALDAEDAAVEAIEAAEAPADVEPRVLVRFERGLERATRRLASMGNPMGTDESGDLDEPTTEKRRRWVANRRSVVGAEARLGGRATVVGSDLACPVDGARFSNDFHYPRSQLRRHLGTDVFGDRGAEIVALADGVVTDVDAVDAFDGDSDLGGISVSWTTDVGRFYAAHLESLASGLAVRDEITAGQPLGTVGTSGNAVGTPPHLHLGWYVDGVAVNPYPTLAVVCEQR